MTERAERVLVTFLYNYHGGKHCAKLTFDVRGGCIGEHSANGVRLLESGLSFFWCRGFLNLCVRNL